MTVQRERLQRRVAAVLLAALLGATVAPATGQASSEAGCAVWVVRNALESRASWMRTLDSVERVGCDRVYLQVSGRWDAYFPSGVFPPPAARPSGEGWENDAFGRALSSAHARGIEVHAWVNALLAWSAPDPPRDPAHVYNARPEWFVRDEVGRSMRAFDRQALDRAGLVGEGWFLDPGIEGVRTELRRFVLELATRYAVDGVHLDYIRYPAGWVPPREGGEAITRLVGLVREDLAKVRPRATLSAAVMPRPDEARRSFGQAWDEWLTRGLVDEVAPMVYRDSLEGVLATVRGWPGEIPLQRVRVGLRIDRLSPEQTRAAAARLREAGARGVALFSHNLLEELPDWRAAGPIVDSTGVEGR